MRRRSLRWKVVSLAALFVLLMLLGQSALRPIQGSALAISAPLSSSLGGARSSIGDFFSSFVLAQQLLRENRTLHSELTQNESQLARLGEVQQQNASLRQQLKLLPSLNYHVVAALVVGHDPTTLTEDIVIDKGSADGIQKGDAVLSDGALVGQCQSVAAHQTKVLLITDPHSAINSIVQSSRAEGISSGTLGYGLEITQIPQNETVAAGDTIITSGLGSVMPQGLLIGSVSGISSAQNDIFQTARIISPINFTSLDTVYVVLR